MDGLITVQDLRDRFDISSDIGDGRLTPHLASAGRRMREWVGDEAYDDALKTGPTDAHPDAPAPQDPTRKETLQSAEAHLAMSFALPGLNTVLRTSGMVKGERSGEGNVITSYFGPNEVENYQQVYLDTAERIAWPYLKGNSDPSAVLIEIAQKTEGATIRSC
jgi:hypothetical protein